MDQDNAGAVGFERLEPGAHALLPRRAAERRSLEPARRRGVEGGDARLVQRDIVRVNDGREQRLGRGAMQRR